MSQPIYYSKVEFREETGHGRRTNIILLNLPAKELSYQTFCYKQRMPVTQENTTMQLRSGQYTFDTSSPAMYISNEKTGFKPRLLKCDALEQEVVFSYSIKLTDEQYKKLLPYCKALDFEPYRNRKMSMDDEGYVGYRDEVRMYFSAVTDSPIPMLELPMCYYYDEAHIWPSEKLYRYLVKNFFDSNLALKDYNIPYGGLSLFY